MEESAPAPAAQNENAAPQETAAKNEKPQGKRWRLHVPTSVVVTLLVAALSVWVAPAFTRQFEDRKQARAMQAQVAEQVALATADVGQRINSFVVAKQLKGSQIISRTQALQDYWQIRQARIDARLRVYFSPEMRLMWLRFNKVIEHEIDLVRQIQYISEGILGPEFWTPSVTGNILAIAVLSRPFGVGPPFADREQALNDLMRERQSVRTRTIGGLVAWMRKIEDKIIDRLMTEDPEAFSTTRGDLLRDLLP
jgi:hypothetical protein